MITVDSSAMLASLDRDDEHHAEALDVIRREPTLLLPSATLCEISYFVERRHGQRVLARFVGDLVMRAYLVDGGIDDFPRVRELVERYDDLPLGFVDCAVIACAERNGGRVLTTDYRHFGVVTGEGTIALVQ